MEREPQTTAVNALPRTAILPVLTAALKEDIGARDLTVSALIPKDQIAKAEIIVHREGVIAGLPVAEAVFSLVDPKIRFQPLVKEGEKVFADKVIAFMEGPARGILSAERTALNFLGHLSGIATAAALFTEKIRGTQAKILDTRKTTPGLRLLEKYAVAVGGGFNHRMGLFDGILIKENHLRMVSHRTAGAFGHLSAVEESVRLARQQSHEERRPLAGSRRLALQACQQPHCAHCHGAGLQIAAPPFEQFAERRWRE